jgi:phosphatidylglycerol---prolipoprotein diacylglyceryl transferase
MRELVGYTGRGAFGEARSWRVQFPVLLWLGPIAIHPHLVFELLAYAIGTGIYLTLRRRGGDPLPDADRWSIIAAAGVGASIGTKLVAWASDPALFVAHLQDPVMFMGGKSVVGGLVGALIAVELVKRRIGVVRPTGDLFAVPAAVAIGIGRIGCFLTGLDDHTHGLPTTLPWAVDFGDGIPRHPTQLYELAFVWILAGFLARLDGKLAPGGTFRLFMVSYLGFRIGLEAIKPGVFFLGLNVIQWMCLATLGYYAWLQFGRRPVLTSRTGGVRNG